MNGGVEGRSVGVGGHGVWRRSIPDHTVTERDGERRS